MLDRARKVLEIEGRAILALRDRLDHNFEQAVRILYESPGRAVLTGIGKSGLIGQKIAATLASTGTPAMFLHPVEALHGDLGMVTADDIVIALSNSGETEELIRLLQALRLRGIPLISIVGNPDSTLARRSNVAIPAPVEEEGCPIGLAPMASCIAALAVGDALAAALMERRGFTREDFARFHPMGSLGRKLLTLVEDLMYPRDEIPVVDTGTQMKDVIKEMVSYNLGAVLVAGEGDRLAGIITDGDIKRLIDRNDLSFLEMKAEAAMTPSPMTVSRHELAERALRMMEEGPSRLITVLPVIDEDGRIEGLLRLHDIIKAKIM